MKLADLMDPLNAERVGEALKARFNWSHHIYLIHAVTARCNADCEFCAWKYHTDFSGEMTTDEIKKMYSDARRAGFILLTMWGGEPLLRKDIGEIAKHAGDLGFSSSIITNGFLLEKKMYDVVPHVKRISISVDHPSDLHDELRGVKGLFERIVSATSAIKKEMPDKKITYTYTMYKKNIDIPSIIKMADYCKKIGVPVIFNPLREEGASDLPDGLNLGDMMASDEQVSEAYKTIRKLKMKGYPIVNSYTYMNKLIKGAPEYICHWPKFILPVEANGDIADCMDWGGKPVANIREKPFDEIIKTPRLLDLAGKEGEACHKCVSCHRVDISESYRGNIEPLISWALALG